MERAVGVGQDRQLRARGLAEQDEAGAAARARDVAVDRRDHPAKRARPHARAESAHRLVVLDRGRHAEERRVRTFAREQRVGALRLEQRAAGRDLDERTDLAVARADRRERLLRQLDGRDLAPP
jgi:hypothetical protein